MDILQALQNQYTVNADLTTGLPIDDTVPGSSEGAQVLSQAITLASADSQVLVRAVLWGHAFDVPFTGWAAAMFSGATCLQAQASFQAVDDNGSMVVMAVLDAPGSVGPHTYTVRAGTTDGTVPLRLNGTDLARRFGGAAKCTLTLLEIG